MTVRPSISPASLLRGQVAVGPLDDDLVGGREPRSRREHRPGVTHGDPVAEQRALPREGRREVDRTEYQHPRPRRVAGHEDLHARAAALAVGAIGEHLAAARGQQARGVVGDGGIGALRAERPVSRVGSDHEPAAHPRRVDMRDHGGDRDRPVLGDVVGHGLQLRKRRARDRFDEDVDDAAAGEPDGECVVVGDSVPLEPRRAVGHNVIGQFVDRALDAAARHRPAHRAVRRHHHRRPGRPRGGSEGPNDGADTRGATRFPDSHQLRQHVTHATQSRLNS